MKIYTHKKTGRACYPFPWESRSAPCPWNAEKYERVVIPLTNTEKRGSKKLVHIQIVRRENLELVKQPRLKLN